MLTPRRKKKDIRQVEMVKFGFNGETGQLSPEKSCFEYVALLEGLAVSNRCPNKTYDSNRILVSDTRSSGFIGRMC